ncbi:transposase family protein [Amycolatopsis carbonis]|uniref:transposase family protein n=1 Tax=Amycolatopsis carbonis TaxID=715471 RepID=UPI003342370E
MSLPPSSASYTLATVLDGTLIPTTRVAATTITTTGTNRGTTVHLWYSGKHRSFGGNVRFLTSADGFPLRTSPALAGSRNDLSAARDLGIVGALTASPSQGLPTLADRAYQRRRDRDLDTVQETRRPTPACPRPTNIQPAAQPTPLPRRTRRRHPQNPLVNPATDHPRPPNASAASSKQHSSSPTTNTTAATEKTSFRPNAYSGITSTSDPT